MTDQYQAEYHLQDLELRLGPSHIFKGGMIEIILIEDDDMQIYSPGTQLQVFAIEQIYLFRFH